jgi:hypothetical protein
MGVKVREKRGKLYLDIYIGGKRTWESLRLTLTQDKAQNKELWKLADLCRSKRETQLLTGRGIYKTRFTARRNLLLTLKSFQLHIRNRKLWGASLGI